MGWFTFLLAMTTTASRNVNEPITAAP